MEQSGEAGVAEVPRRAALRSQESISYHELVVITQHHTASLLINRPTECGRFINWVSIVPTLGPLFRCGDAAKRKSLKSLGRKNR